MSMEQDISLALQRRAFEMQFEELWRSYSKMEEEVRNLRIENKRLKSEQYKSEELPAMQTKLDEMHAALHRGFPVSKEESRKANEWITEQKNIASIRALRTNLTTQRLPVSVSWSMILVKLRNLGFVIWLAGIPEAKASEFCQQNYKLTILQNKLTTSKEK